MAATISIEVRGQAGLAANFRAMDAAAQRSIRTTMKRRGEEQRQETERACPKDTGFMASRTRVDFSPEGLTYAVGYNAEDFTEAGLEFYPQFVIFGTSRMSPNNFLFAVHEMMQAGTTKAVGDDLRASFARFRK